MADQSTNLAYPMMFDPSQFANKFSNFQGKKLTPYLGQMQGLPTDAFGNVDPSYTDAAAKANANYQAALAAYNARPAASPTGTPGTTLNSGAAGGQTIADMVNSAAYNKGQTPGDFSQASNSTGNPQMDQLAGWQALTNPEMAARGNTYGDPYLNAISKGYGGGQRTAAPAAAAPPSPPNMTPDYMAALQSPAHVFTPGSNVPQPPQPTGQSGVMDQFLANWKAGGSPTTGAGNYNNAGFFRALQGA